MEKKDHGYFDLPSQPKHSLSPEAAQCGQGCAATRKKESKGNISVAPSTAKLTPLSKVERKMPSNGSKVAQPRKKSTKAVKKKEKKIKREKMSPGDAIKSEKFKWRVIKLLGSGGFGDVYKVKKEKNADLDTNEYAMKTEMVLGNKRMLRLKIEVTVLQECHDNFPPNSKGRSNFVSFIDRGITDKFKFLVMGLVGPSLDDIRRSYLLKNYSKHSAMQSAIQTLTSIKQLHSLGWLHRDIKPQNFAVGLGEFEDLIYMLDFGIARKIYKEDGSKEIKVPRAKVQFLGTPRFAARACHRCEEQGRKDDLETWIYMVFDLFDGEFGLPWKKAIDKAQVLKMKDKFFKHDYSKTYKIVPKEMKKLVDYCGKLKYYDAPDYSMIERELQKISKEQSISLTKKMDWIGKLNKKRDDSTSSSTSTDNQQSGDSGDSTEMTVEVAPTKKRSKISKGR